MSHLSFPLSPFGFPLSAFNTVHCERSAAISNYKLIQILRLLRRVSSQRQQDHLEFLSKPELKTYNLQPITYNLQLTTPTLLLPTPITLHNLLDKCSPCKRIQQWICQTLIDILVNQTVMIILEIKTLHFSTIPWKAGHHGR